MEELTSKEKYYHFTGVVPEDCEAHAYYPMTDEEIARIRELTVEAYKAYVGPDYDDENWASTFEEICEDCKLCELEGFNAELDKLLFNITFDCDGLPLTIFSIDLQHGYSEEKMDKMFGKQETSI